MPKLPILFKVGVVLLLLPNDECRQTQDNTDDVESVLLNRLLNPKPVVSKPFKKSASKPSLSLTSPSFKLVRPFGRPKWLTETQPSYSRGQEASWYIKGAYPNMDPHISSTDSTSHVIPSKYTNSIESSQYAEESPLRDTLYLSEKIPSQPQYPLGSLKTSNAVHLPDARLTLCQLRNLMDGHSPTNTFNGKAVPVLILQPKGCENVDQPPSSQARSGKTKIHGRPTRLVSSNPVKLKKEHLVKKQGTLSKKMRVFTGPAEEKKFRQLKKYREHKIKIQKIAKINPKSTGDPVTLKKTWKSPRDMFSRKSTTQRCFKTRRQDGKDSRTICVTYPASWGEGANYTIPSGTPYPYYYPYYYYPMYYYQPYYFYGRR